MAYLASKVSPTTRLIKAFLISKPEPQSSIDISDAVGASYWTVRDICKSLVTSGEFTLTMRGKSPHYSVPASDTL